MVTWDEERHAFVLEDPQHPHKLSKPIPEEDVVEDIPIDNLGLMLYGIGVYKWAWKTNVIASVM